MTPVELNCKQIRLFEDLDLPPRPGAEDVFPPVPPDLAGGWLLRRFRLLECLGRGGFGVVYRARDEHDTRADVAIKHLRLDVRGRDTAYRRTLQAVMNESVLHARASDHPHVCGFRETLLGDDDGSLFLVMDYCEGGSLQDRLDRGPIARAEAVAIARQIADGLAHLHARKVHHLDLKPANVLRAGETWKIADFGIAERFRDYVDPADKARGTPPYMAPEQASGTPGAHADRWALGMILFHLLTGQRAFPGRNVDEIYCLLENQQLPRPSDVVPTIPAALDDLCANLLNPVPNQRMAPDRVVALLQAWEEGERPPAVDPAAPAAGADRSTRKTRRLALAALGLGLLALTPLLRPRTGDRQAAPAAPRGRLRASVELDCYRDTGVNDVVDLIATLPGRVNAEASPRVNDYVRVHVSLTRAAYVLLVALNTNHTDQLCVAPSLPVAKLRYPDVVDKVFQLEEGPGMQGFLLIASDRPFPPYDAFKATLPGGMTWTALQRDEVWVYDGSPEDATPEVFGRERLRGKVVPKKTAPPSLVRLCDTLREWPGVELVHAVSFPVPAGGRIAK